MPSKTRVEAAISRDYRDLPFGLRRGVSSWESLKLGLSYGFNVFINVFCNHRENEEEEKASIMKARWFLQKDYFKKPTPKVLLIKLIDLLIYSIIVVF